MRALRVSIHSLYSVTPTMDHSRAHTEATGQHRLLLTWIVDKWLTLKRLVEETILLIDTKIETKAAVGSPCPASDASF